MSNYYNPYYQPQQMLQQMVQPQIQNGGRVSVWAEQEARNYPVARGTSVTFRDETAPFIYTKSMGFGQQDIPIFEKFKKVEDESEPKDESTLKKLEGEIASLRSDVDALKKRNTPNKPKNDGGN